VTSKRVDSLPLVPRETRVFHFLFLDSQLVLLQQPIKEVAFHENVLEVGWKLLQ
jgi:hypothetical protein